MKNMMPTAPVMRLRTRLFWNHEKLRQRERSGNQVGEERQSGAIVNASRPH